MSEHLQQLVCAFNNVFLPESSVKTGVSSVTKKAVTKSLFQALKTMMNQSKVCTGTLNPLRMKPFHSEAFLSNIRSKN